jgi:hypothetical protein
MALIDYIETYGHAVATGQMTVEDAVAELIARYAEANLRMTEVGAADLIANWQTTRASIEREQSRAFHGKAAIENGRRPHPSSKPKP